MTKKPTQAVESAPKRPRGRPSVAPEDKAVVGAVRLTVAQWSKFHALGGAAWLRERINRAKAPP